MTHVMSREMQIETPLGDDVLLFLGMTAHDELGRLSEYTIDLLSADGNIDTDEIRAKKVSVRLLLPDASPQQFNGYVTRFSQSGTYGRYYRYCAVVRPWLWFLTRTADCRIFQDMTVPDILKAVFAEYSTAAFRLKLTENYHKWTYCVQYRETDFNFVSRLMEYEGIYYYFTHTDDQDTMVVTDSYAGHAPTEGYGALRFIPPARLGSADIDHISHWEFSREVQPGSYVLKDFDFERPSLQLRTHKAAPQDYAQSDHEMYDYPGRYVQRPDGEHYAAVRLDEFGTQFETARAVTNARGIRVGSLLRLQNHPRADQNREYLILAADYDLEYREYEAMAVRDGCSYRCGFVGMPSQQSFRPTRLTSKPFVQGPQTAMVVGPSGDEIYTDEYGRVKVQFHWDRYGKRDERSSCWIRVSQGWAGKSWGAVTLPRIGQEVIVDFLEGDPDQPIITGRVYNAESMPPYGLPKHKTRSTLMSRSSPNGGGGNYNEVRLEDKKGSEQIFINAERDMDLRVEHDAREFVGNNRHLIVTNDQREKVQGDRHVQVMGNQHQKIGKDMSLDIGMTLNEKTGVVFAHEAGEEIHFKAGRAVVIESGLELTIKSAGGFITINSEGIYISGNMVFINSGGAPVAGSGSSPETPDDPDEADDGSKGGKM